ncbi:MAG: hypothetical protein CVV58_00695 [Tenericutes bacterium HGW-Tenericutes-3]|nr:MAG: hypothetical protein CVV58_00695 [Tenericutes bacterium HGW-Tenericutes-3]
MSDIKGVNLGGWFVLESWIKPSLFENIDSRDETGFCTLNPHAKQDLIKHWETFITKEDFIYLKSIGINSVRLPIPWWLEGEKPYFSALPYIHKAFKWADEVGIDVLLDLHTAPGCQNGFDNGGIEGVLEWHLDPKHIELTVEKLGFIAKTFKGYKSFWGLEVLNEPHYEMDLTFIADFYIKAYVEIRKHTDKVIVFHDAFRPSNEIWKPFFANPILKNVMFDLHYYHCFSKDMAEGPFEKHINIILNHRLPVIREISQYVDIIIGEWSLGIKYENMILDEKYDLSYYNKLLAALQLYIYSYAKGYYFWTYRVDGVRQGWDFKKLIKEGILPDKY